MATTTRKVTSTARRRFVSALHKHGIRDRAFSKCTNAIYVGLFGKSCREMLASRALPAASNLRDHLAPLELSKVQFAEELISDKLETVRAADDDKCEKICSEVAQSVSTFVDRILL